MCISSEEKFDVLCSIIERALEECEASQDFQNGRTIMNMAFTFYFNDSTARHCPEGTDEKSDIPNANAMISSVNHEFIYSRLKHMSLWRNIVFWSYALCDVVYNEIHKIISIEQFKELTMEEQEDLVLREKNIAFATLLSFGAYILL